MSDEGTQSPYSEERSGGKAGEAAPGDELGGATGHTDPQRVAASAPPSGAGQGTGPSGAPENPGGEGATGDPIDAGGPPEHTGRASMGGPTGATTGTAGGVPEEEDEQ